MKYCTQCGIQLADDAAFCTQCGAAQAVAEPQAPIDTNDQQPAYANDQPPVYQPPVYDAPVQPEVPPVSGLARTALIFMIIGTIVMACSTYCLGLIWCLPMTLAYNKALKNGTTVSTGFKVCSLIFVSTVGGILMLCDRDH